MTGIACRLLQSGVCSHDASGGIGRSHLRVDCEVLVRVEKVGGIMMISRVLGIASLILTVFATEAQDKAAVDKVPLPRSIAASGKQTYKQYCASCHGLDGRGDGPAAFVLKTAPADLTTLAKRHGGKFPYEYVSDVLKFGTRIVSHGSSDMPIWGPIFGSLDNYDEFAVRKRIKDLSDYLASLQQKES
jgi:mono/diheme cytochrome c family protein